MQLRVYVLLALALGVALWIVATVWMEARVVDAEPGRRARCLQPGETHPFPRTLFILWREALF